MKPAKLALRHVCRSSTTGLETIEIGPSCTRQVPLLWRAIVDRTCDAPTDLTLSQRRRANVRCLRQRATGVDFELDVDRRLELGGRQRQIAQALSGRIGDGIGDPGGRGILPSLASAQERQLRAIDDVHLDAVPHAMEA